MVKRRVAPLRRKPRRRWGDLHASQGQHDRCKLREIAYYAAVNDMNPDTFGSYVSKRRKELGLSQKDMAGLVLREEDLKPISPQYLNDIERDRRKPSSDHLVRQFASALNEKNADYLFYLVGTIPEEFRSLPREHAEEVFKAFRRPTDK